MNKKLKFALFYVLLPLLCVALAIVAGLNVPATTSLDLNSFSGLVYSNGVYSLSEWEHESDMEMVESYTLAEPGNVLRLVLTSPGETHGRVAMFNDQYDEVGSVDFNLVQGRQDFSVPLAPGTISVQIHLSDAAVTFSNLYMVLQGHFYLGFALLAAFLPLAALALFLLRRKISDKPEYGFLIVGVVMMVLFFALLPQSESIIWDAGTHLERTEKLAYIGVSTPLSQALTEIEFTDIGYLPGAIGMRLASLFTENESIPFLFTRIFNSLTYLLACFFAVKCAKRYKMIFAIAALIPTALYLGNSCNYDLMVNGFMYLSTSLMISQLLTPKDKLRSRDILLILFSFLLACLPKAVYVPLILLLLFLPKEKFHSSKQRIAFNVSIVLVFLLVAATFVLPALLNSESLGDVRGGNVDPTAQVRFILSNPVGYASLLIQFMFDRLFVWANAMTGDYAYMGMGSSTLLFLLTSLLIYTGLTDTQELDSKTGSLTVFSKCVLSVLLLLAASLVCTSMFIAFTEVGAVSIAGVQARYFIPLVPAILILLQPRRLVWHGKSVTYNVMLFISALVLNLALLAQLIIFK